MLMQLKATPFIVMKTNNICITFTFFINSEIDIVNDNNSISGYCIMICTTSLVIIEMNEKDGSTCLNDDGRHGNKILFLY